MNQFANIFGKPREGIHSYRIFDVAIVDLGFTIILAFFVARYMKQSFILWLVGFLIFSVFIHLLFGVKTKFVKLLGLM
jgi:hypothetical protein